MTIPQDIPIRRPGDPLLTAAENNALIRAARKDYNLRRGISNDGDSLAGKDSTSPLTWLLVTATEAIPAYSIFSIQSTADTWNEVDPVSHTKKVVDGDDLVYVTNEDDALISGDEYYLPSINFGEPYLITYDPADGVPTIGGVLGPKPNTYVASVVNKGLVAVSEPDTTNDRVWVLRQDRETDNSQGGGGGGDTLYLVTTKEDLISPGLSVLQPGGEVQGHILSRTAVPPCPYEANELVDITIFDANGQNCVFAGETVIAVKRTYTCNGTPYIKYEPVGSHGLRRRGVVAEANGILCGASGVVNVWIDGVPTLMPFAATNKWGYRRDLRLSDEVYIEYDLIDKAWIIVESAEPIHADALLTGNMCGTEQNDQININNFRVTDRWLLACASSNETAPTTVYNKHQLAGRAGDVVSLHRNINYPITDYRHWEIVNVDHHRKLVVTGGSLGACSINLTREWQAQMDCAEVSEAQALSGVGIDVVTGMEWNGTLCRYTPKTTSICVLNVGAAGPDGTPLPFTQQNFVVDVYDDTGALKQFKNSAGMVCIGTQSDHEILQYTDCPTPQATYIVQDL